MQRPKSEREYTNGEVTVVWKPSLCIHTGICFRGLPEVFDPKRKPWVKTNAGTTEQIIDQIRQCPSHALSYYWNRDVMEAGGPNDEEQTKSNRRQE